jgi:serine/threonine-protein kinase
VKVLDFGLAKALDPAVASHPDLVHSPTFTSPMTQMGVVLGTAAYMAPEQAKGKAVDKRADIWAFGVVLFEMLAGARAFKGDDVSDVIAAVLRQEIDWQALPAGTPAAVRRLLARCLERDPKARLRDIGDVWIGMDAPDDTPQAAPAAAPPGRRALPWSVAAMALIIAAGAGFSAWWRVPPPRPLTRLQVNVGADVSMWVPFGPAFAITPDGRTIVMTASGRLYVRSLDSLEARPLQGTENASDPFISPDGLWVGFVTPGKLRKIALAGGAAVDIATVQIARGAWWGRDGNIYYTPTATAGGQVMRVPDSGGTRSAESAPVPVGPFVATHVTQRWPQVLPGGKALIYTGHTTVDTFEEAALVVHPLDGSAPRELLRGGYHWRYVPSGHLVYIHAGTLFAVPFDLDRLEITGAAVPVVEGVLSSPVSGGAQFGVSPDGTLAYVQGANLATNPKLSWLDLEGNATPLREIGNHWESLSLSPDGTQLAVDVSEGTQPAEIWIYDLTRDTQSRLTLNQVADIYPIWTRDSQRVVFSSAREGPPNLFWQKADNSEPAERLLTSNNVQVPTSWHPDGRRLMFGEGTDLHVLTLPEKTVTPFLRSPANEGHATFSPDGRWVAYASDESGQFEVYVRPFPTGSGLWPISTGGAAWPMWSPRTSELYYVTFTGHVMAVPFETDGPVFRPGKRRPVGSAQLQIRGVAYSFGLHPDGRRFVTGIRDNSIETVRHDSLILVMGFTDDLKARVK